MLRPRVVPFILISDGKVVKTSGFLKPKYVGDPLNTIKLFNDLEVDEIFVADIACARSRSQPNFKLLERMAKESRMPFGYAGGVANLADANRLVSIGVEKIGMCSAIFTDSSLVQRVAESVGRQSVVGIIDYKTVGFFRKKCRVVIEGGTKILPMSPSEAYVKLANFGVGEIVLSSVDRDGSMTGYDYSLA